MSKLAQIRPVLTCQSFARLTPKAMSKALIAPGEAVILSRLKSSMTGLPGIKRG